MWLLVAAPTVSRTLPLWAFADTGAWCEGHGQGGEHADMAGMEDMVGMSMPAKPDMPGEPALHMDQCGYCALLAHTPLLSGAFVALLLAAPLPTVAPDMGATTPWHAQPLLSAHPRGPPLTLVG